MTGTNGKTTTVRMIAHILKLMGRRVGMTSTDGIVVDGRLIKKGDMSGPQSADGAAEPDRRHGGIRGGARRDPARGSWLRPQRRGRRHQRDRRPPRSRRHQLDRPARQRQGRRRRSRAALGERGPQRRRHPRLPHGPPLRGRVVLFSMSTAKGEDGFDRVEGTPAEAGRRSAWSRRPRANSSCSSWVRGGCPCSTRTSSRRRSAGGPG